MAKRKSGLIRFNAKYEDGKTLSFQVDTFALRSGDFIAQTIAREMQQSGQLPAGKIVSIERAPFHEQP